MKKTLIVVAHPDLKNSVVNQRWVEELRRFPQQFTVHDLYASYPDGRIDGAREQALIEQHEALVLQFPIYWFNCTPLLKQWLDEVFTYGWAYGASGDKLKGKKVALAVSVGAKEEDYQTKEGFGATLQEVLRPFELTLQYVAANYRSYFVYYAEDSHALKPNPKIVEVLEQGAKAYLQFLSRL